MVRELGYVSAILKIDWLVKEWKILASVSVFLEQMMDNGNIDIY